MKECKDEATAVCVAAQYQQAVGD